jgi:hypothetical protein
LQKTISTCLTDECLPRVENQIRELRQVAKPVLTRQMIDKARTFGMHLLAAATGIRKTLSTAPFENPANAIDLDHIPATPFSS